MYEYEPKMQLWASPICEGAVDDAIAYINAEAYTHENAKIVKTDTQILVIKKI